MATIGTEWTKLVEYTSTDTYSVTYRLYAKITATNIGSNTNTVQMKWTTQKTSGGSGVYDNTNTTPSVTYVSSGSTTATWTGTAFNIPQGSAVTETDRTTSGNITITHDSNGSYTKTWNWSLSHVYEGGSKSGSVSVTLPTIPRASTFALSSTSITTIGTTTATITRADSSFSHKISTVYSGTTYYLLGSASATSSSTSASLSIPAGLRNAMRTNKASSVTLTLTLTTYSGSTSIGTSTTQLTVSVPTATITVSPSSVSCDDTSSWTLANIDTEACVYTVQRLYGSTVRYTDLTRGTTTTASSLANANFQANITTATSGTVTAKVTTYVGTSSSYSQVGTNTATYTVTIPTGTYKPSVANTSITRTGTAYGSVAYLSGYNGATVVFTTSINGNSAITSREVSVTPASVQYTTSISGNTVTVNLDTLPSSASNYTVNVVCTATDGRGTTASATRTFTATGYSKPTINATIQRADASGNADAIGTYANISATATAPQTAFKMANVTIRYNTTSGTQVVSQDGTTQSITASVTHYGGSYNINTEYTFYVIATDSLGLQSTYKLTLPTASVVFSRHKNGGIGFGRVAKQGRVESAYNIMAVYSTTATSGPHISIVTPAGTSTNGYQIGLHIGSGGANRGLYDFGVGDGSNSWIIYKDINNQTNLGGTVNINTLHIKGTIYVDSGAQTVINSGVSPYILFGSTGVSADSPVTYGGRLYFQTDSAGNENRFFFREYSPTSADTTIYTSYYENFYLPTPTKDRTSNGFFTLLSTKSVVTEAQGGTGQSSLDDVTVGTAKAGVVTTTNPASGTHYYLPFLTGASGNRIFNANNGVRIYTREGTTEQYGFAGGVFGNTTNEGTAGNKYGFVRVYPHTGAYYAQLQSVATLTGNRSYYLPNISGTLAIRDATVTGTLTNGSWVTIAYPTGYSQTTCHVTGWDVDYNGNYRTGDGLENSATTSRVLISLESDGIKVYTGSSTYNSKTIRVFLSLNA